MYLKEKLNENQNVFGTWCLLPSPEVINVISKAGLDFVIIDMEHGTIDFVTAQKMVMAAEAEGSRAVIRVSKNEESEILRALDLGIDGIIVPHIDSVEEREKAISYIKYPPSGIRGFSPYTRAGGYRNQKDYTESENKRVLTGIIVEGESGIKNIYDIADDPQLDLVYVGTYDISSYLGIPGEVHNIKVKEILEHAVSEIKRAGKIAGCLFHNWDDLDYFKQLGIQFLVYKVDSLVLYEGFSDIKKRT
ncbi:MAG: aldolase/citrate lyase family protein [bacterium]